MSPVYREGNISPGTALNGHGLTNFKVFRHSVITIFSLSLVIFEIRFGGLKLWAQLVLHDTLASEQNGTFSFGFQIAQKEFEK